MIRLSETETLDNYFIDENAVITDENGNVQKQYLSQGRYKFKGKFVHKIMLNTFIGIKDGDYVVHHLDQNKLNNKLSNLVYLTRKSHTQYHKKGKHHSAVAKDKMSTAKIGEKNPNYGKHLSKATRAKMSAAKIGDKNPNYGKHYGGAIPGFKWWNNGIKSIRAKECPQGFVAGMLKNKQN